MVVGLSAMIGAGVFSAFAPAARAAGAGLLLGLAIAAVVAFCNAAASAQLATAYPTSGGTYSSGREVLGEWAGFTAGWAFVVGKTASCAAMAIIFAAYAVPGSALAQRSLAVLAVAALTAANLRGVTRTSRAAKVLLSVSLMVLLMSLAIGLSGSERATEPWVITGGVTGVLQSAGLMFFAFAGFARIATLAEEVRRPDQLTRAILISLGVAVTAYAAIGVMLIVVLGPNLAATDTPIADAVTAAGAAWVEPIVRVGAAAASLGALLALLAGVSRTSLAMARERDLPTWLSSVHPVHRVPDHAQLVIGVAIILLVLIADLRDAIGFSSCGVLIYYAIANLAALRQAPEARRWPRGLNVLGLFGCLALVATLPAVSMVGGLAVIATGLLGRVIVVRRRVGAS